MSWFIVNIECGVDDVGIDVNGIAGSEDSLLVIDPLFDLSFDAVDDFFLIRVAMEVVAHSWIEIDVDDGEVLVSGFRWAAEPAEVAPVEMFSRDFVFHIEFIH